MYSSETGTEQERDYEADTKLASLVIPDLAHLSEDARANAIDILGDSNSTTQAKVWYILMRFLENSYWTRLWVIQEIVLASKQIVILAAGSQFAFEEVDQVADMVRDGLHTILGFLHRIKDESGVRMPGGLPNFKNIATQRLTRNLRSEDGTTYSDVDLDLASLLPARSSMCTDPRDRIYGLLGLMSHALAAKVTVKYEKPVEELYFEFAASLIENTGSLFALDLFPFTTSVRARNLPSWVPDLREDKFFRGLTDFSASSNMGEFPRPRIVSEMHLTVHGLLLDRIDGLGATSPLLAHQELSRSEAIVQTTSPDQFAHAYTDFEGLRIAFWGTLNCVEDQNMDESLPLTKEQFVAMCETSGAARSIRKILQANDGFLVFGYSVDSFFAAQSDDTIQELESGDISTFHEIFGNISEWTSSRRLACTVRGRLGLVPAEARQGDTIYALKGLSALAVLRKRSGGWTFIGACYVYGLMDGESRDIVDHLDEVEEITIL